MKKSLFGLLLLAASYTCFAGTYWVDVRTPEEFAQGHLKGAVNVPLDQLDSGIAKVAKDKKNDEVKLYCRSGKRSGQALSRLQAMGYQKASNEGGLDTLGKKYPVVK